MIKNKLVSAESEEVFSSLDQFIFERMAHRLEVCNANEAVFGYGEYFLARAWAISEIHSGDLTDINSLTKIHVLCFLVDECEQILKNNRSDVKTPAFSASFAISIANFLLQVHKKGIYKRKTEYLLNFLLAFFKSIKKFETYIEQYVRSNTINLVVPLIKDQSVKWHFNNLIQSLNVLRLHNQKMIMETTSAKPPRYPNCKPLAVDIAVCDSKRVQPKPLQSILKNVKRHPI